MPKTKTDPACTVCGQTYTDPSYWGDESLEQIQEKRGWPKEPMVFEACPHCLTVGVCPDCHHERHCCDKADDAAADLLAQVQNP